MLDSDSLGDDLADESSRGLVLEVRVEEAGEVGVHTLVTRDELVGEGKTGHETTLLEPEDGSEGAREEDTLDGGESNQAAAKCRVLVADPLEGSVGLSLDARNVVDGVEEVGTLLGFANVCVDEQ